MLTLCLLSGEAVGKITDRIILPLLRRPRYRAEMAETQPRLGRDGAPP